MTALAVPVVTVQVGLMAMGVVDIVMIGRVSPQALAAVALGHVYVFALMIFGLGMLQALDPLVSQAIGAGDHGAIGAVVQRACVLAFALTVPASLVALPAGPVLELLGQPAEAVPIAAGYVHASIPSILPFLVFALLRQTLQAFSATAPIVLTIVVANVANVLLNWLWIFGNLGFPALGAVGCAWATTVCRWLMAVMLLLLCWRRLRPHLWPARRDALQWAPLLRLARLGLPIGTAIALEYGAFMSTALLMGSIGLLEVAGHQVAINLASLSFMFPLGIGAAAAVRVGYAVGRSDASGARRAAALALLVGAVVMAVSGAVFLAAPRALAGLYTDQLEVVAMAALLIPLAGVFQVFDGVQAVAAGVLRGLGDTRAPMVVHLIGFWVLGIPLGCTLAFGRDLGPRGLWWGLVLGLAVAALVLVRRVQTHLRRGVERVRV